MALSPHHQVAKDSVLAAIKKIKAGGYRVKGPKPPTVKVTDPSGAKRKTFARPSFAKSRTPRPIPRNLGSKSILGG